MKAWFFSNKENMYLLQGKDKLEGKWSPKALAIFSFILLNLNFGHSYIGKKRFWDEQSETETFEILKLNMALFQYATKNMFHWSVLTLLCNDYNSLVKYLPLRECVNGRKAYGKFFFCSRLLFAEPSQDCFLEQSDLQKLMTIWLISTEIQMDSRIL